MTPAGTSATRGCRTACASAAKPASVRRVAKASAVAWSCTERGGASGSGLVGPPGMLSSTTHAAAGSGVPRVIRVSVTPRSIYCTVRLSFRPEGPRSSGRSEGPPVAAEAGAVTAAAESMHPTRNRQLCAMPRRYSRGIPALAGGPSGDLGASLDVRSPVQEVQRPPQEQRGRLGVVGRQRAVGEVVLVAVVEEQLGLIGRFQQRPGGVQVAFVDE